MNNERFTSRIALLALTVLMMTLITACGSSDDDTTQEAAASTGDLAVAAAPAAESKTETTTAVQADSTTDNTATDNTITYTADDLYTLLAPMLETTTAAGPREGGQRGEGQGGQRSEDGEGGQRGEGSQRGRSPLENLTSEQIRLQDGAIQLIHPQSGEPLVTLNLSLVDGQLQSDVNVAQFGEGRAQQDSPLEFLGASFVEALMNDLQAKGADEQITAIAIANNSLEIGF